MRVEGRWQPFTERGRFGVLTQVENSDISVLGRDVTDNFEVLYKLSEAGGDVARAAPQIRRERRLNRTSV